MPPNEIQACEGASIRPVNRASYMVTYLRETHLSQARMPAVTSNQNSNPVPVASEYAPLLLVRSFQPCSWCLSNNFDFVSAVGMDI